MTSRELLDVNFAQQLNSVIEFPDALRQSEAVKHQRAVVKRSAVRYTVPTDYNEGQTVYIKMSDNDGLIVPPSARLRFKLTNKLADTEGDMSFPNLVTSIFNSAKLWMGGQLVDEIEQDAGLAVWAIAQQTMSRNYYDSDGLYTMRGNASKVEDNGGSAYFEVPLSLLFGSFRQYKFLPLRNMENGIEIRLGLKNTKDAMYISADNLPKYTLSDIEVQLDMVYLDSAVAESMDTLVKGGVEKLVYPVHTWYVDKKASSGTSVEVRFNRSTSHCRNLIFFQRTDANINKADAGYELKSDAAKNTRLQIGGTFYPTYGEIPDLRSAWSVTRNSLSLLGHAAGAGSGLLHKTAATINDTNTTGYSATMADYENLGYSLVWSFEKLRETEDLDSDAMNLTGQEIQLRETLATNEARQIWMVMEYTRFVVISNRMIEVKEE